jgi:hypothetical protein
MNTHNFIYRFLIFLAASFFSAFQANAALPNGWLNADIAKSSTTVTLPGTAQYDNDVFTLAGSGGGLRAVSDRFHYAYKECSGDVEITARITSQSPAGETALAGIMIRESNNYRCKFIFAGAEGGNRPLALARMAGGKKPDETSTGNTIAGDGWYRLIKQGNFMCFYFSTNGTEWTEIGFTQTHPFTSANSFLVGLAVSSGSEETLETAVFDNVTVRTPDVVLSDRGVYFSKKKYVPQPVPAYAANRNLLPKPILDGKPGWIDMYYKAWQLGFAHIKAPVASSPFVSNWYDEAFDGNIYQWDIIFMTMFGRYAHHIFPGIQSLDNFYCRQKVSGSISRTINETTGADMFDENSSNLINPPIFSWAEVESFKVTGDKSRFAAVLPVLEKYYEFVHSKRYCGDTPHKLYWSNGQSSGMDNTPRDTGRPSTHWASDHQGWVDASAQMVIQCNNIATICDELGYTEKAATYRNKARVIADSINSWMWSEADGFYYDVKVDGTKATWKTNASFWPLLAGITTAHQDSALMEHLKNPNEFWRDIVFPTLAATHKEYQSNGGYCLGAVIAALNYMVIKGIETVGADEFARESSERYLTGLYEVFVETGTLWENYAPDKINGKYKQGVNDQNPPSDCRRDFVGWTGLGPISLLIENVLGFRVNGATKTLTYDLRRTDRHGIENLRMADVITSIVTGDRAENPERARVTVTSNQAYTLQIVFNNRTTSHAIAAGTQIIDLFPTALPSVADGGRGFQITPNPVDGQLTLHLKPAGNNDRRMIKIFDISGKELFADSELPQTGSLKKVIDVSHLAQGIYFLCFQTSKGKQIEKFLKK